MAAREQGAVDRIVERWTAGRPDLDSSPIGVIGRVSRLSRLVDRRLGENFARFGLENWMYDVLATLRRRGPPYELTAGMLVRRTMVTTRDDHEPHRPPRRARARRAQRGRRQPPQGHRAPHPTGVAVVDEVAEAHMAVEHETLRDLSPR